MAKHKKRKSNSHCKAIDELMSLRSSWQSTFYIPADHPVWGVGQVLRTYK
jgi:hypothetical protein